MVISRLSEGQIKLACNYSPELIELIEEKRVDIDYIKLSKEFEFTSQFSSSNEYKPALLHFVPRVPTAKIPEGWSLQSLNRAIKECKSPHIALHLRSNPGDFETNCSTRTDFLQSIKGMLDIKKVQYDAEVLIENMPITCLPEAHKVLADPDFIHDVCVLNDIGLCLDLAHAQISAYYMDMTIDTYFEKLPLDNVKEIHVSRAEFKEDKYLDTHMNITKVELELLSSLLDKLMKFSRLDTITLEYGGEGQGYFNRSDKKLIESQLKMLKQIVGG